MGKFFFTSHLVVHSDIDGVESRRHCEVRTDVVALGQQLYLLCLLEDVVVVRNYSTRCSEFGRFGVRCGVVKEM
jgi:hypothetical protein